MKVMNLVIEKGRKKRRRKKRRRKKRGRKGMPCRKHIPVTLCAVTLVMNADKVTENITATSAVCVCEVHMCVWCVCDVCVWCVCVMCVCEVHVCVMCVMCVCVCVWKEETTVPKSAMISSYTRLFSILWDICDACALIHWCMHGSQTFADHGICSQSIII